MNDRPLNLLRYPQPARVLDASLVWSALWAGLAGVLMAGGGVVWLHRQHDALHNLRRQLQSQSQALTQQQATAAAEKARSQLQAQLAGRARAWQQQGQDLDRLQATLTALAETPGLRLERWHGDGRRLLLQGSLPAADGVPLVLSGLSDTWAPGWGLQSLAKRTGPVPGIDVVFEAPWPMSTPPSGAPKP